MKLANIKNNELSTKLLVKLSGVALDSNEAKPSPESIVIGVEYLIIPITKGNTPINTVPNEIPIKLIN